MDNMIREQITERADIGDGGESDEINAEEFDATSPSLPGSVFVNTGESVINKTEEETPDASDLVISRPNISRNASPRPLVRKRSSLISKERNEKGRIVTTM